MAVGVTFLVDSKHLRAQLSRLGKKFNERQVLEAIGLRHLKWINDNLRQAGLDIPHKPIAPNTIEANPRRSSGRHLSSRFRSVLAQSFNSKVLIGRVIVGTQNELAAYHHFGTKPFTIRPKNKEFLQFRVVGGIRRTRKVSHPGIPARPLLPTKAVGEKLAFAVVKAVIERAANF